MYLLRDHRHLAKTDEMRRAIEDLKPDDYRRLGCFDKGRSAFRRWWWRRG
jgi:hypothetical protein